MVSSELTNYIWCIDFDFFHQNYNVIIVVFDLIKNKVLYHFDVNVSEFLLFLLLFTTKYQHKVCVKSRKLLIHKIIYPFFPTFNYN